MCIGHARRGIERVLKMEGEGANTQAQHAWRRGGISEDGGGGGGRDPFGGRREGGRPLGNQISTSLLEGAGGGCWLGWRWWGENAVDREKTNVVACSARWGVEEGEGGRVFPAQK